MTVKVKICGLKTEPALDAALAGGADFVGFNFYPPSPRSLSPSLARGLAERARGRARSVAVLVDPDDRLLERIVTAVEPELIQLHGCETPDRVAQIARTFARPVIKVLSVQVAADAEGAAAYAGLVQHVLFDAKPPTSMADPLPGGNGLSFDWRLLVGMRHRFDFILSGGLTPDNVADAVRLTDAYAVDVASGVEVAPGEKSPELIGRFLAAAKSAPATV